MGDEGDEEKKNQSSGREERMRTVFMKYSLIDHGKKRRDELLRVN